MPNGARLRIAKPSISKRSFSFQKTIDLREKNAIFNDQRRVHDRRVKTYYRVVVETPESPAAVEACSKDSSKTVLLTPRDSVAHPAFLAYSAGGAG